MIDASLKVLSGRTRKGKPYMMASKIIIISIRQSETWEEKVLPLRPWHIISYSIAVENTRPHKIKGMLLLVLQLIREEWDRANVKIISRMPMLEFQMGRKCCFSFQLVRNTEIKGESDKEKRPLKTIWRES